MRLKHVLPAAFLFWVPIAHPAVAERCDLAGCGGQVGYVFLPPGFFPDKPPAFTIVGGGQKTVCASPEDDNPVAKLGLPPVNAVVEMRRSAGLYSEVDIANQINNFAPDQMISSADHKSCSVHWSEPDSIGDELTSGEKVRVLGYRTFVARIRKNQDLVGDDPRNFYNVQVMFAQVLVLT